MRNRNREKLTPEEWQEIMGINSETVSYHYSYPEIIIDFYNSYNEDDLDACWYEGLKEDCILDGAFRWNNRYTLPYHSDISSD